MPRVTQGPRYSRSRRLESGFLRGLRREGAKQWPQSFAATLGALDRPFVVLANRQGQLHFAFALVTVVLVHWHSYPPADLGTRSIRSSTASVVSWSTLSRSDVSTISTLAPRRRRVACSCNKSFVRASLCSASRGSLFPRRVSPLAAHL